MAKIKSFQVVNGRIHFKCPACQGKRMLAVPPVIRQRTVKCHKCGESTRCGLNRRGAPRQIQSGRVMMFTNDGKYLDVDLYDISQTGVGFEIPFKEVMRINPGNEVYFRCTWNPFLLNRGRYKIQSIKGRRVGAARYSPF